jgi:hypothetical protein
MESIRIVLLCIAAPVAYGIVHDQVTARICIECLTIGHSDLFGTKDSTLLGIGWGIVATWWVGPMLGVPMTFAARWGKGPKLDAKDLVRPLGLLLTVSCVVAVLAGLVGFVAASRGWVVLLGSLASEVPQGRHVAFLVDLWAHSASYACGLLGGIWLVVRTWRRRERMPTASRPGAT